MALIQCPDCTKEVSDIAPFCVHCGKPSPENRIYPKSKMVAAMLALFLGGIGAHKFYLNKPVQGFVWLVLTIVTSGFWLIVPLLEGLDYLFRSDRRFHELYVEKKDRKIKKHK